MEASADSDDEFWILALSGGGYRGLYLATVLDELEKRAGQKLAEKFDLIAGTSVGGIVALALAKKISAMSVRNLFEEHGPRIFAARPLPSLGVRAKLLLRFLPMDLKEIYAALSPSLFHAKYEATYIKSLLERDLYFSDATFADLNHRLIVPTVNYTKGEPQFFKTPHHPRFERDIKVRLVDAALATSAAPTYFPLHRFDDSRYVDGGLIANDPTMVAVHEAVHILGIPFEKIHVLSIGTMNTRVNADTSQGADFGLVDWKADIFHLTINAQEAMTHSMMKHALGERYLKIDTPLSNQQADLVGFDKVTKAAIEALRGQAKIAVQEKISHAVVQKWLAHVAKRPKMFHGKFANV